MQCTHLTVFGDSLSDDGIEVGDSSYGFNRNSNGPVWSEYLNKMLGCEKVCHVSIFVIQCGEFSTYHKIANPGEH